MNLLTKFQPDLTVEETEAAIRKFSSSLETLRMLLQLLKKFQPDPTVNKESVAAGSC